MRNLKSEQTSFFLNCLFLFKIAQFEDSGARPLPAPLPPPISQSAAPRRGRGGGRFAKWEEGEGRGGGQGMLGHRTMDLVTSLVLAPSELAR